MSEDQSQVGDDLPELDFETFIASMAQTVLLYLGDAPSAAAQVEVDLTMARHNIDILALLQEKTKGNLSGREEHLLDQTLYDLRMRYLEVSKSH